MRRIICIGNRYVLDDAAGPRVHDRLCGRPLPEGVELIDGGLGGLDLLRHMDGAERVVLVDAVRGFCRAGGVVLLDPAAAGLERPARLDHATGIAYLLASLPHACERSVPEVLLLGVEAPPGAAEPDEKAIDEAARMSLLAVTTPSAASARSELS